MIFKPNYRTKDGLLLVMMDKSLLTDNIKAEGYYPTSKEITTSPKVMTYNNKTKAFGEKSVYKNKKGFYIKGKYWYRYSYLYYLDELEELE